MFFRYVAYDGGQVNKKGCILLSVATSKQSVKPNLASGVGDGRKALRVNTLLLSQPSMNQTMLQCQRQDSFAVLGR